MTQVAAGEKKQVKEKKFNKYVSYSQYSMYYKCPRSWKLAYVDNLRKKESNIHLVFGTSMHEVIQDYLEMIYNQPHLDAESVDWKAKLLQTMNTIADDERNLIDGKRCMTDEEFAEFIQDGNEILDYFLQEEVRQQFFSKTRYSLSGIETSIDLEVRNNVGYIGFLDVVLFDKINQKYKIIDLKTSTRGWNKWQKSDESKTHQLLLYKVFYAKEFNVPLDKIEVEFIILKRKHDPDDVWSGDRIQRFVPPHGSMSSKEAWTSFNTFLNESFTKSGEYNMDYSFPKTPGKNKKNCRWCEFAKKSGGPCDGKEGE
tara:strand:+ start:133 stop:1071 length:939 start_codon:yes stop_codon:yes gene_type:complete